MKEKFERLDWILNHKDLISFCGGKVKQKFLTAFESMKNHIENDIDKDSIPLEDIELIKETAGLLEALLIERISNKNIVSWFVNKYSELLFNWNENYLNDEDIINHLNNCMGYINGRMTIDQTIQMFIRIKRRVHNYTVMDSPNFKLSRHYWDIIEEED